MRLLAVDDDPVIRELLPVVFAKAKMTDITLAASGEEALQILAAADDQFDCLLLDIEMPGMGGITLCKNVRALPEYADTPILMLTSVTAHTRIERAFAAGANDYVTKPFDVKEIATRVRVAERMAGVTQTLAKLDPLASDDAARKGDHEFSVEDAIRIADVNKMILPFSLGNYLSQLSRRRLDACAIFAIRISDVETLYDDCKSHEFAVALSEVADTISETVENPNLLMSYEGNGIFMCITQGGEAPLWPEVETAIQAGLSDCGAVFDNGEDMALEISVGNPVPPNASRNQRVKKTFERAVGRVLTREKTKVQKVTKAQGPIRAKPRALNLN